jgi:hypothetical protein
MTVYKIEIENEKYKGFYADDVDFELEVQGYLEFKCTPKGHDWVPPKVYMEEMEDEDKGTQPVPDIAAFRPGSLVLSPRATEALKPILERTGELLPLPYQGETWFILNVTECVNALDKDRTEYVKDDEDGTILGIRRPVFYEDRLTRSSVFKIADDNFTSIYCHSADQNTEYDLKRAVESSGLRGIKFTN